MASEDELELYRTLRDGQDKLSYFLLASAAAAIGFAMQLTQDASVSTKQIPLAIAVLCWSVSFYYGCRYIRLVHSCLQANAHLLGALTDSTRTGIENAFNTYNKKANASSKQQFRMLIVGAMFFISWHVTEMVYRPRIQSAPSVTIGNP